MPISDQKEKPKFSLKETYAPLHKGKINCLIMLRHSRGTRRKEHSLTSINYSSIQYLGKRMPAEASRATEGKLSHWDCHSEHLLKKIGDSLPQRLHQLMASHFFELEYL